LASAQRRNEPRPRFVPPLVALERSSGRVTRRIAFFFGAGFAASIALAWAMAPIGDFETHIRTSGRPPAIRGAENTGAMTTPGARPDPAALDVAGVLLDIEGTVVDGDALIPGADRAIAAVRAAGLPVRFVTNTTRFPRDEIVRRLRGLRIPVEPDDVFTAPRAAAAHLAERGIERASLLLPDATLGEFAAFRPDDAAPQAVVVGDLGSAWTFERLDRAFRHVMDGAMLVAVQRNRYWRTPRGLTIDAGPFVAALEFATGQTATVCGKPSPTFFAAAARSMGVPLDRIVMAGDDVAADVAGARACGAKGVLVRTGKFRQDDLGAAASSADAVLTSVADLPTLLGCGGPPRGRSR
jgi:HAD superfamily hydrolase (TIGR01458 family)